MATQYLDSFVGVKDGTLVPPTRQDGRKVGAKVSSIIGSKVAGQVWANGDKIFAGTLRTNESLREALLSTDTSFGTTTMSLGTIAAPTKYVNAITLTAPLDRPVIVGPLPTAADDAPLAADEDLYWTLGVGGIGGAVLVTSELRIASVK